MSLDRQKNAKNLRVGVLGSGQLAQMLIESSQKDLPEITALAFGSSPQDPAALISPSYFCGQESSFEDLRSFFNQIDVLTFESEFCDIKSVKAARLPHLEIRPSLESLAVCQNKLEQKRLFQNLGLKSSDFIEAPTVPEGGSDPQLREWLEQVHQNWGDDVVLKWSRLGYDGKGIHFAQRDSRERSLLFLKAALKQGVQSYAEKKVSYTHEVACSLARDVNGHYAFYPLVISQQERGICKNVSGPATAFGIAASLESEARIVIQKIADSLEYLGLLSIEFFIDPQQNLLINEIAPRVHNSAHYSQDATNHSQFENHIRCVAGNPAVPVSTRPFFVMYNILGPDNVNYERLDHSAPPAPLEPQIHFHWYGKKKISPRRKLGHLNGWAHRLAEIEPLIAKLKNLEFGIQSFLKREHAMGKIYGHQ